MKTITNEYPRCLFFKKQEKCSHTNTIEVDSIDFEDDRIYTETRCTKCGKLIN